MTVVFWLAVAVLAFAVAHIVAAWIYANSLDRDALRVGPRIVEAGIWVRGLDRDRITLEAAQPRQDIGHPGTFGLTWDDGRAIVGDVVAADTGRIVRSFERVDTGVPPVCLGQLNDCDPVSFDGYVYDNPGEVGLTYEEVTYRSPLGSMGAWLVPGGNPGRWAVHCHGWRAERRELVRLLRPFHEEGRTSLVIDYRNDPGAPLDPTGRYRFGLSEWEDLEAAVRHALESGAEDLVLTGCSTGGALVMRFLERSDLRGHISGVVLDAPNIVLAETFRRGLQESRGSRLLKETALVLADWRWHIDWETTNYIPRAAQILTVPTLVFHGTSDHTVPIAGSRRLQAEVPDFVDLVETPAAGHVLSWNVDPERYEGYIARFLDRL